MFPTIRPEQLKPKLKSQLLKVEKINRRRTLQLKDTLLEDYYVSFVFKQHFL